MGKMEQKIVGSAPELGLDFAGDGDVGDAVKELPGKPDGFNGLFFGVKDVTMVIYDGTLGKIGHKDVPPFGINEFPPVRGVRELKTPSPSVDAARVVDCRKPLVKQ
jgi:hypothetical protein